MPLSRGQANRPAQQSYADDGDGFEEHGSILPEMVH
jgi:hypothetical protein